MDKQEWLDNLKPGDTIYQVGQSGYNRHDYLIKMTVQKRTATQIVMEDGKRFNKNTGKRVGGGQFECLQLPPSDGVIQRLIKEAGERRVLISLQKIDWYAVDVDIRQRIYALLYQSNQTTDKGV